MNRQELIEKMAGVFCQYTGGPVDAMSAVLDLLTKEAVETRRSQYQALGNRYAKNFSRGNTGTPVSIIILDLPSAPSATKRAADLLRSMAKAVDGIDADVLTGAAEEAREIADKLEKEARDAADGS